MEKSHSAMIAILLLISMAAAGYAAEEGSAPPPPAATVKEDDRLPIHKQDEWQFFLTPYLWIPGINANVSTLRGTSNPVIPWWDVIPDLFSNAMGAMGRVEVWKGRWGVYLDGYFIYVGGSGSQVEAGKERTFGPVDLTVDKQLRLGRLTISVPIPGQVGPGNITLTPSGSVKYISRLGNLDFGGRFLVGTCLLRLRSPCRPCPWNSWAGFGSTPSTNISELI